MLIDTDTCVDHPCVNEHNRVVTLTNTMVRAFYSQLYKQRTVYRTEFIVHKRLGMVTPMPILCLVMWGSSPRELDICL